MAFQRMPSEIMQKSQTRNSREYAMLCYRRMLISLDMMLSDVGDETNQQKQTVSLFAESFHDQESSDLFYKKVLHHLDVTFGPGNNEEHVVILPPLFLRANENRIVQIHSHLFLILFDVGPVIPVVYNVGKEDALQLLDDVIHMFTRESHGQPFNTQTAVSIFKEKKS
jgi:hypothetical protein